MSLTRPFFLTRRFECGVRIALCLSLCASVAALAAPPPGHPSPGQTQELLMPNKAPAPKDLPHEGRVISTLDANEFSYIEVMRDGVVEWIAAPLIAIEPGSTVRFEDGSMMAYFYSKLLQRTFSSIRFVGDVRVLAKP